MNERSTCLQPGKFLNPLQLDRKTGTKRVPHKMWRFLKSLKYSSSAPNSLSFSLGAALQENNKCCVQKHSKWFQNVPSHAKSRSLVIFSAFLCSTYTPWAWCPQQDQYLPSLSCPSRRVCTSRIQAWDQQKKRKTTPKHTFYLWRKASLDTLGRKSNTWGSCPSRVYFQESLWMHHDTPI